MKRSWIWMAMMALPLASQAAEPMKLASTRPDAKRFLSLDGARQAQSETQTGLPIVKESKAFVLRSDKSQMQNGFMRIDRGRIGGMPSPAVASVRDVPPANVEKPAEIVAEKEGTKVPVVVGDVAAADAKDIDRESEEIVGNKETYDPVLSLFDGADHAPLSSFSEAMRGAGRASASVAGLVHHLVWPVALNVKQSLSSGYGMRADPFHGRSTFHGGIDIAAQEGTAVLATADANVMQVATDMNYGKYVTLQHADGTLSRYGHLSAQIVTEGQRVKAGEIIGAVGKTGHATGAHLDYRVSKNGVKFDPLAILTVPSDMAMNAARTPTFGVTAGATSKVASNAVAKRAMVIQVR